jgi:hypothetical protein
MPPRVNSQVLHINAVRRRITPALFATFGVLLLLAGHFDPNPGAQNAGIAMFFILLVPAAFTWLLGRRPVLVLSERTISLVHWGWRVDVPWTHVAALNIETGKPCLALHEPYRPAVAPWARWLIPLLGLSAALPDFRWANHEKGGTQLCLHIFSNALRKPAVQLAIERHIQV